MNDERLSLQRAIGSSYAKNKTLSFQAQPKILGQLVSTNVLCQLPTVCFLMISVGILANVIWEYCIMKHVNIWKIYLHSSIK